MKVDTKTSDQSMDLQQVPTSAMPPMNKQTLSSDRKLIMLMITSATSPLSLIDRLTIKKHIQSIKGWAQKSVGCWRTLGDGVPIDVDLAAIVPLLLHGFGEHQLPHPSDAVFPRSDGEVV